jgi:hypothetical protein
MNRWFVYQSKWSRKYVAFPGVGPGSTWVLQGDDVLEDDIDGEKIVVGKVVSWHPDRIEAEREAAELNSVQEVLCA